MNQKITPEEAYEERVEELNRDFAIFPSVMSPRQPSTKLFLKLIHDISSKLKDKYVLDLGCGSGALSIALGRASAKVIAVDINEDAIKNTKSNVESEPKEVKEKIIVGLSDLYTDLEKITGVKTPKFDFIFFNNPTLEGMPVHVSTSCDSFAGKNFEINLKALSKLPSVLKENGIGYFLVIESKNKLQGIWTDECLREALPKDWACKKVIEETIFDKTLGLGYSVYEVYK